MPCHDGTRRARIWLGVNSKYAPVKYDVIARTKATRMMYCTFVPTSEPRQAMPKSNRAISDEMMGLSGSSNTQDGIVMPASVAETA